MNKWPHRIFLQCEDPHGAPPENLAASETTWCVDRINETDREYIDLVAYDQSAHEENDRLHEVLAAKDTELARLTAENAELRGYVEKLPKTADGVPVNAGDNVYDLLGDTRSVHHDAYGSRRGYWIPVSLRDHRRLPEDDKWIAGVLRVDQCYSTREAAEAAREGGE